MYGFEPTMQKQLMEFAVNDGEEDEDDGADLQNLFSFDPDQVAEALKRGATLDELVQSIEDAMAQRLEQRLADFRGEPTGLGTPPRMGDLTGLMTPPDSTPKPLNQADLSARLAKCRRSSVVMAAVNEASTRHRHSLVQVVAAGLTGAPSDPAKLRQSLVMANRLHRLSLVRAAEVLEAAGVEDRHASVELQQQLELVQQAVKAAQRRHRLSVVRAVAEVTGVNSSTQSPASASPALPRVRQAIVAAYARTHAATMSARERALMNTRVGIAGKPSHFVHCGPLRTPNPPNRAVRRIR